MAMRFYTLAFSVALLLQQIPPVAPTPPPPFEEWLSALRAEAATRGISEATLDGALTRLEPLPIVIERDRSQAELVLTLDRYLQQHLSKKVVTTAQRMRQAHAERLK